MTISTTLLSLKSSAKEELGMVTEDSTLYSNEVELIEKDRSAQPYSQEEYECALRGKELTQIEAIITARATYADKIFNLVIIWLIVIAIIIFLQGFCSGFELSDKVLMSLIGGTTLNIIGIFMVVANFIFPKNGHSFFSREPLKNKAKAKKKDVGAST